MTAHAPTTPEDAVIRLDQSGERIPARPIESLNRVPRPHDQLSLARQARIALGWASVLKVLGAGSDG
jgi:hypothetical protein